MASVAIFKFIFAIVLLLCIKLDAASRSDLSNLINVLGQRYGGNRQPIIVVVDTHKTQDKPKAYLGDTVDYIDSSDETIASRLSHILQRDKVKKLLSVKKTTHKPHLQLKQHRHRIQKLRADDRNLDARSVLRSPIVKKLLRISNSIQCEAKDECQDKCSNKYNGKKVTKCEAACEEKYECDEEEEDPCDKNECPDSCGDDEDCPVSTKGERYVTDAPCKKCG
uniref:Seminal fluid protein HACP006 n=1 Tax=Heliconius melpomene TaxID=34740 RepID=D9HQ66_HELME